MDTAASKLHTILTVQEPHVVRWSMDIFCHPERFRGGLWHPVLSAHHLQGLCSGKTVDGTTLACSSDDSEPLIGLQLGSHHPTRNNRIEILSKDRRNLKLRWEATVDVNWDNEYGSDLILIAHASVPWIGIQVFVKAIDHKAEYLARELLSMHYAIELFDAPIILPSISGGSVVFFQPSSRSRQVASSPCLETLYPVQP